MEISLKKLGPYSTKSAMHAGIGFLLLTIVGIERGLLAMLPGLHGMRFHQVYSFSPRWRSTTAKGVLKGHDFTAHRGNCALKELARTRHPGFRDKKIAIGFLLLVLVVQVKFCRFFAIHGNCKFSDRGDLNQAKGATCFIQKITPRTLAALKLHWGSK